MVGETGSKGKVKCLLVSTKVQGTVGHQSGKEWLGRQLGLEIMSSERGLGKRGGGGGETN